MDGVVVEELRQRLRDMEQLAQRLQEELTKKVTSRRWRFASVFRFL